MTPGHRAFAAAVLAAAMICGCNGQGWFGGKENDLSAELEQTQEANRRLSEENTRLKSLAEEKAQQIQTLQALGDKRLDKIYHVAKIELGRYTGGIDTDQKPGHDAVKVYLQPVDADGSTIKAAGSVKVQLYDLAAEPKANLVGEYAWDVDEARKHWASGFMTNYYSFICPWKSSPPEHDEITVRVEFVDYLTGKTFTAQKACKLELPEKEGS